MGESGSGSSRLPQPTRGHPRHAVCTPPSRDPGGPERDQNGQQACPRHTPSARLAGQHPLEDTRPERRPHRHGPCPNERGAEWAPCGTGCVCLGEGAGIRDLSSRKAEHRWPHAPVTLGPSCALEGGCSAGARRSRDRSQVQTPRDRSPPPH